MTMPQRVAVIDVSHWHSTYDAAYMQVLRDLGREIVGVSDTDQAIVTDRAARVGARPFRDYREMIETTRPEFVIALGRHCDMPETFRWLVDWGVPFVMEKPWGTDAATVAGLADYAERKQAWVAVPFITRYSFWAVTAKQMLEAGELGPVSHIVLRMIRPTMQRYVEWDSPWMSQLDATGGGALLNLGGHGMDVVRFLTGEEPEVLSAVTSRAVHQAEVEDYALATLRTPSGIIVHNEVGYTMPTWPDNRTDGEQKVAGATALVRAVPEGVHILGPGRDEVIATPPGWETGSRKAIRDCLEALDRDAPPPIGPRDCAAAVRLIHDAYRLAAPPQGQGSP